MDMILVNALNFFQTKMRNIDKLTRVWNRIKYNDYYYVFPEDQ